MKKGVINYKAYQYLQALIPRAEIIGLEVKNNWLVATLSNRVRFSVLNND